MNQPLMLKSNFLALGTPERGKVRDIYDLGSHLLLVTTDRISAFDVVLPNGIYRKGEALTRLSALWLTRLADIIPNHLVSYNSFQYPGFCPFHAKTLYDYAEELSGRSMLVKKAKPLPVECIVRGYLAGSGWKSYQQDGTVCGIRLPTGLVESDKLPTPIFTPSTKAKAGAHDENISFEQMAEMVGTSTAFNVKETSLRLYCQAQELAERAGIIIADTKFEFGRKENGEIILIDEVLTPDSSRFWPAKGYAPGGPQPSFDKQFVRDYLESIKWNKQPPAPKLPRNIVQKTSARYLKALKRLTKVLAR